MPGQTLHSVLLLCGWVEWGGGLGNINTMQCYYNTVSFQENDLKCCLPNANHFADASMCWYLLLHACVPSKTCRTVWSRPVQCVDVCCCRHVSLPGPAGQCDPDQYSVLMSVVAGMCPSQDLQDSVIRTSTVCWCLLLQACVPPRTCRTVWSGPVQCVDICCCRHVSLPGPAGQCDPDQYSVLMFVVAGMCPSQDLQDSVIRTSTVCWYLLLQACVPPRTCRTVWSGPVQCVDVCCCRHVSLPGPAGQCDLDQYSVLMSVVAGMCPSQDLQDSMIRTSTVCWYLLLQACVPPRTCRTVWSGPVQCVDVCCCRHVSLPGPAGQCDPDQYSVLISVVAGMCPSQDLQDCVIRTSTVCWCLLLQACVPPRTCRTVWSGPVQCVDVCCCRHVSLPGPAGQCDPECVDVCCCRHVSLPGPAGQCNADQYNVLMSVVAGMCASQDLQDSVIRASTVCWCLLLQACVPPRTCRTVWSGPVQCVDVCCCRHVSLPGPAGQCDPDQYSVLMFVVAGMCPSQDLQDSVIRTSTVCWCLLLQACVPPRTCRTVWSGPVQCVDVCCCRHVSLPGPAGQCNADQYSLLISVVAGMCPSQDLQDSVIRTSTVEELADPIPELFSVLTEEPDELRRWSTYTYPAHLDLLYFKPRGHPLDLNSMTGEGQSQHIHAGHP